MIRIARLDLERWGHFEGRSLRFGAPGQLHVVYGDNEAGKSTTRRAITALLFGVPERTTDTYGRKGGDLRIGAALELDGTLTERDYIHGQGEVFREDNILFQIVSGGSIGPRAFSLQWCELPTYWAAVPHAPLHIHSKGH